MYFWCCADDCCLLSNVIAHQSTPNLAGDIAVVRLERPTSLGRLPVQLAPPRTRVAPNCSLSLLKYGSFQLGGPTSSGIKLLSYMEFLYAHPDDFIS